MSDDFLNKKQELFCKFVAGGETQTTAYELAGYSPSTSNACTLANKPEIKKRIAMLRAEHLREETEFKVRLQQVRDSGDQELIEKEVAWTFNRVMDMIAENVRLAQIAGEFKAANEGLKMLGDGMAMFTKESEKNGNPPTQSHLTLIGKVVNELGEQGAGVPPQGDNPLAPRLPSTGNA